MDLKEVCANVRNWMDLIQDRDYLRTFVNAALNLWFTYDMGLVV